MKKLCELVDIAINNENCVVFKVKDNTVMDLISLGCFKGAEDMIRMTKGRTPEITVFNKDGSNYSYHFGERSTTVISENMTQQRSMIRECAILDFGIVCDWSHMHPEIDYDALVKKTSNIKSLNEAERLVTLVSGGGMSAHIRINEQHIASDVSVKEIPDWFEKRGYSVSFDNDISKGMDCGRVLGRCAPIKTAEKTQTVSSKTPVGYVQEHLHCDEKTAKDFIEGFNAVVKRARNIADAHFVLQQFEDIIFEEGLHVGKMTEDDFVELGIKVGGALEDHNFQSSLDCTIRWLREHSQHKVGDLIEDASKRSDTINSDKEATVDKEHGKA